MGTLTLTARVRQRTPRALVLIVLTVVSLSVTACFGTIAGTGSTPNTLNAATTGPLDTQLLQAALTQFENHQYKNAIEDFEAAYSLSGASTSTRYTAEFDLGVLYIQENDLADAEAAFMKSLSVYPAYPYALNDLAILESKANPKLAISLFNRLLKTNPAGKAQVYTSLSALYDRIGDTKKGAADLALAASINAAQNGGVVDSTGPSGASSPS